MRGRAAAVVAAALTIAISASPVAAQPQPSVALVQPTAEQIVWRGIPADEGAGAQGLATLYPAPNLATMLAGILTHAAIVQGARESERRARQEAADAVLKPLAPVLSDLTPARLMEAAVSGMVKLGSVATVADASPAGADWVVELRPTYAVSADHRTLVLDNTLKVYAPGQAATPKFANIVRVVSARQDAAEPLPGWLAEEGIAFRREAASMLAHSVALAMRAVQRGLPDSGPARTFRYPFSTAEKMERGTPVAAGCRRAVLRTLRDGYMSVPVAADAAAPACNDPYELDPAEAPTAAAR